MKKIFSLDQMNAFGLRMGRRLHGGECIELIGDVGTGKTTLTKAIARGLGIDEDVQSPSFTISRTYPARNGLELHHYDFYRLHDPGIMRHELAESVEHPKTITVIEWGESVTDVLPGERVAVYLQHANDTTRLIEVTFPEKLAYLAEGME